MKTLRKHFASFCLLLVGSLIALVLAEGLVRIFFPHVRDYVISAGFFEIDDYLGWKLAAGKSTVHHTRYFDVLYRINALGYRDKPHNLLKGRDIYRILLYGDSQIFGWGVPEAQRFSNLVEGQKRSVEIWNLAVPGYGLDQELLSYEKDGQSIKADEVVFFVSRLTLLRTIYDYIYKKSKPKFAMDQNGTLKIVPVQKGTHALTSTLYKLLSPFYLPYFVERFLDALKETFKESSNVEGHEVNARRVAMGELQKRILERARSVAFERGQRITVLAFLPQTAAKDFRNFCDQKGIGYWKIGFSYDFIDLALGRHDHHWNIKANKLIAEQILSQLNERAE